MTIPAIHFESRLVGFSKKQDKNGDWCQIVLQVHPDDLPMELMKSPLKSIWMVGMAKVGEDGKPEPIKTPQGNEWKVDTERAKEKLSESWDQMSRVKQSAIRCNDPAFQSWIAEEYPIRTISKDPAEKAAERVRAACQVQSRTFFSSDDAARKRWEMLDRRYREHAGQVAERR